MGENNSSIVRYRLDPSQSKFNVQAFARGLLAGFGHDPTIGIRDFTGEVLVSPNALAEASVRLGIKASSLTVLDEIKENDRREMETAMRQDVLETSAYPEIIFKSTSITATRVAEGRYKARIIGEVSLHGVTRTGVWIQAQVVVNADELRAQGEFTLKQTDYKIKPFSFASGALKLKDELKFSFDLVGRKDQG